METNEVTNENNRNVEDTSGSALDSKTATIEVTVDNSELNIPSNEYKTCTGIFLNKRKEGCYVALYLAILFCCFSLFKLILI